MAIYILPNLCWLYSPCSASKPFLQALSWLMVLFGIALSIVGTIQSAQGMFSGHSSGFDGSGSGDHEEEISGGLVFTNE
eukprot:SAG31_NODE_3683_length_3989_cov_3.622108_3_plen_79_part_00